MRTIYFEEHLTLTSNMLRILSTTVYRKRRTQWNVFDYLHLLIIVSSYFIWNLPQCSSFTLKPLIRAQSLSVYKLGAPGDFGM